MASIGFRKAGLFASGAFDHSRSLSKLAARQMLRPVSLSFSSIPQSNSITPTISSALKKALVWTLATPIAFAVGLQTLWRFASSPITSYERKERNNYSQSLPKGWQEKMVVANGVRLFAVSGAEGEGKPLMLFAHGFPECWYSWRHQMEEFEKDYHVVAINLRGYGPSEVPQGQASYSVDTIAADLAGVVKALGHSKAILVAHDWGGVLAWRAAEMFGDVFERLVVICAPHPKLFMENMNANQFLKSWYMLLFQVPWLPETMLTMQDYQVIDAMFTKQPAGVINPNRMSAQDVDWYKETFSYPGTPTAALNYYRQAVRSLTEQGSSASTSNTGPLRQATCVIWAKQDVALGTQLVRNIKSVAPRSELHVLDNCSHWAQQDRPDEVNRLMRNFLSRTSTR